MALKQGDAVRIANPIDGEIEQVKYNEDTGEPRYLVKWADESGEEHRRWFGVAELSETPA